MDDWSYHKNKAPYASDDGPKVIPSWVAYLDILGYSDFIIRAMEHEDSSLSLKQLRSALDDAYYQIRSYSQMEGIPFYSIKIFTDNIVLGFPVQSFESFGGYEQLDHTVTAVACFQAVLVTHGFLVRGGIAFGHHYMDDDIVFGGAFLEAVKSDVSGSPPRVVLLKSATHALETSIQKYSAYTTKKRRKLPIFKDTDDALVVNHLEGAFPKGSIDYYSITDHRRTIVAGLSQSHTTNIHEKYLWLAKNHNKYIESYPGKQVSNDETLSDFVVNIE